MPERVGLGRTCNCRLVTLGLLCAYASLLGSQPRVWARQLNRPEFGLVNADIAGSGPRMLHVALDKPEFNLTNADIEGSKTQIVKF